MLVLATGFNSTRQSIAGHIRGRRSRLLGEEWSNGMAAHASTTVHGFPNMYVLDGPNAALGHNSAIYMIETQVGYVLSALDHLADSGADALEVTAEAVHSYMRDIDTMARDAVWVQGGCTSWYRESGPAGSRCCGRTRRRPSATASPPSPTSPTSTCANGAAAESESQAFAGRGGNIYVNARPPRNAA